MHSIVNSTKKYHQNLVEKYTIYLLQLYVLTVGNREDYVRETNLRYTQVPAIGAKRVSLHSLHRDTLHQCGAENVG